METSELAANQTGLEALEPMPLKEELAAQKLKQEAMEAQLASVVKKQNELATQMANK
ncbi:hypothetical protein A2U01_0086965, partial [Trifolium medium]|nr:hypothetical protein [Trifolium medium]